jgi:hypothetical protein
MREEDEFINSSLSFALDLPGKVLSWMGRKVGVATVAERVAVKRFKPGSFFSPAHEVRTIQAGSDKISFRTDVRRMLFAATLARPVISYFNPSAEEAVSFVNFCFTHLVSLIFPAPDVVMRLAVVFIRTFVRLDLVELFLVGRFGAFVVFVTDFPVATRVEFLIYIPSSAFLAADIPTLTLPPQHR